MFDIQEYAKFSISEIIGGRMLDKEKLLTELEGTKQQLKEKEVIRRLGKTRCDGYIDILIALIEMIEDGRFDKEEKEEIKLSLREILLRKPNGKEIWRSEEHGIVVIDGCYIDIEGVDTWLIHADDLFTLVEE